jgi:hypothetical protein
VCKVPLRALCKVATKFLEAVRSSDCVSGVLSQLRIASQLLWLRALVGAGFLLKIGDSAHYFATSSKKNFSKHD